MSQSVESEASALPTTANAPRKRAKARTSGSIQPYGTKGYRVRLSLGVQSDTGKRLQFDEVVPTLAEAKAKLEEFKRLKKSPDAKVALQKVTLGKWIDTYFATWAGHLRPRTKASYQQVLSLYVPDALKLRKLSELSTTAMQEWLNALSKRTKQESQSSRETREKSGDSPELLSRRTVAYCRSALRLVMQEAVRQGLLANNVVRDTKLASESARRRQVGDTALPAEDRAMKALSEDEVRRFLAAADARTERLDGPNMDSYRDRLAPFWRLALETGMRPSEMLGLRWRDVQLETLTDAYGKTTRPSLTITHSLTSAEGDGVLDPPKTARSVRTVPLSSTVVRLLKAQRRRQAMDKLKTVGAYRDNDFVFATGIGTPMDINNVRNQAFLPLLKAAGIDHRRLYDLRHTAITHMLTNKVDVTVVSQRAGHASVKMTLDVYAHVLPGQQEEATDTMGALLDRLNTTTA